MHLKEKRAEATYKWLRVISDETLFKTVSYVSKELNNRAVLTFQNIVYVTVWSLVMYSNCLVGMKQYYNISIYCNIYYSNTIQYGLKEISIYCNILQCLLS